MTDRNDSTGDRDNTDDTELGAFLRSEVPEPGVSYWDNIDAMLNRVEGERGPATPEPEPRHLGLAPPIQEEDEPGHGTTDFESLEDGSQTDEGLIRLTDMTTPTIHTPDRRLTPMLVAAALIVVAGFGTLFAIDRLSSPASIDAAGDGGSPSTEAPVTDDSQSDRAPADDGQTTEPSEVDSVGELTGRRCYGNGSLGLTLDIAKNGTFTGWQVPIGFGPATEGLTGFELPTAPNGNLLMTLAGTPIDGIPGPGRFTAAESRILAMGQGYSSISTSTWTITDAAITQPGAADDVQIPAIDCGEIADDLDLVESTFPFFPELSTEPMTITETATTAGQNRACYRAEDGTDIMVFDFSDDRTVANAFRTGALETISATLGFDSQTEYNLASLILGDLENGRETINTFLVDITPERIEILFDGQQYPAIDCATVADELTQAEFFLANASYPAYPLGS